MFNENPYNPSSDLENSKKTEKTFGKLATPHSRLSAFLIDNFVYLLVLMPIITQLGIHENPKSHESLITVFLLRIIALLLINGFLLATKGQSVGKWAMGIQIIGTDGELVSLSRIVFWRYLPFQIMAGFSQIGIIGALIDILMIFREDHRCLHDHLAKTVVIEVDPDNPPQ